MRKKRFLIWVLIMIILGLHKKALCQDPIFSQYYNAPLQLNPALAGNTWTPNLHLNYRNQWPGLPLAYTTYNVSYSQFIDKMKSGIGLNILADNAGNGILKTTNIQGYYSYRIRVMGDTYIKGGINVGYGNIGLAWEKLIFGDALDPLTGQMTPGGTPIPTSEVQPDNLNTSYFSVGSGFVLYSPEYYFGISLQNMNSPNIGYYLLEDTHLPMRFSIHGGKVFTFEKANKLTQGTHLLPNIMFAAQGKNKQLNLGTNFELNALIIGGWFRHSFGNSDALIFVAGIKKDFLKISYSFDYTVSGLTIGQGGAHEVSISLNFDGNVKKKTDFNDCFAIFR